MPSTPFTEVLQWLWTPGSSRDLYQQQNIPNYLQSPTGKKVRRSPGAAPYRCSLCTAVTVMARSWSKRCEAPVNWNWLIFHVHWIALGPVCSLLWINQNRPISKWNFNLNADVHFNQFKKMVEAFSVTALKYW